MKNKKQEDDTYLARWLAGTLSEVELKKLQQSDEFPALQQMKTDLEWLKLPEYDVEQELGTLLNKVEQIATQNRPPTATAAPIEKTARIRRFPLWGWAVAASIALVIATVFLLRDTSVQYSTGIGEQLVVNLPDGSTVQMNAMSKLTYQKTDGQRQVALNGEAFFEVQSGIPFIVKSPVGSVEVLGTSFNVLDRTEEIIVRCYSGRVQVKDAVNNMAVLSKGQAVKTESKVLLSSYEVAAAAAPTWTKGVFEFKNVRRIEAIEEFKRQYPIQVKMDDTNKMEEIGTYSFPKNDLETAVQMVFGAGVKVENGVIDLRK